MLDNEDFFDFFHFCKLFLANFRIARIPSLYCLPFFYIVVTRTDSDIKFEPLTIDGTKKRDTIATPYLDAEDFNFLDTMKIVK